MNWICPICGKKNEENWICECGFDESKNYEKYPTLTKIDESFSFLPSKNVLLYKFTDVLRKIVDREKSIYDLADYVKNNKVEEIEQLLNSYPRIMNKELIMESGSRYSLLAYAIQFGSAEIVKLLLERGEDPNAPKARTLLTSDMEFVSSVLSCALDSKKIEIVELLLVYGANPNDVNARIVINKKYEHYRYQSVLSCAIETKQQKIIELLLKYGADPNIDKFEQWNINGAWTNSKIDFGKIKNVDIIELLLRYGASSETIKNMGWLKTRKLKKKLK